MSRLRHCHAIVMGFIGCIFLGPDPPVFGQALRTFPARSIRGPVEFQMDAIQQAANTASANAAAYREFAIATGDMAEMLQRVDLDMKIFRAYWQKKQERLSIDRKILEQKLENARLPETRRRGSVASRWEGLYNAPEKWKLAAAKGTALNLMLDQLAVHTTLPYSAELPSGVALQDEDGLRPDFEAVEAIRVHVPGAVGGRSSFKLTEPVALDVSWWPMLLRETAFDQQREALASLRATMAEAAENGRDITPKELAKLEATMSSMTTVFFRKYPPHKRKGLSMTEYHLIFQAEDFLRQLDQDIHHFAVTGRASVFSGETFQMERHGKNMAALFHYMLSNNLRFDVPRQADQHHYVALTNMTKHFCQLANVSPDKEWIEAASIDADLTNDEVPRLQESR